MANSLDELNQFLDTLANASRAGDRVPTVRELMSRFSASQVVVQIALGRLKDAGLIDSYVGRGTFFRSTDQSDVAININKSAVTTRSVLLLRRSVSIQRGRYVIDSLQRRFNAQGHRVLEVSYTDPNHARTVLRGLPRFDACVVQSSFETITIETLAALRQKTETIVIDGLALVGANVDAVGLEWGEPLTRAIHLLEQRGHRNIAFATTTHPFLANALGVRRLIQLQTTNRNANVELIHVPSLPQEDYAKVLLTLLSPSIAKSGALPFTALVVWGIEDGAEFRTQLTALGVRVPSALSVVLLGRTDLPSEHANFFDTVGGKADDQVEYLYEAVVQRWAAPQSAFGVRLLPVVTRAGQSIAAPSQRST
jgi:DNA-binding LacI/PurR family transcriptional regulator